MAGIKDSSIYSIKFGGWKFQGLKLKLHSNTELIQIFTNRP